jgi:hypothetical protein
MIAGTKTECAMADDESLSEFYQAMREDRKRRRDEQMPEHVAAILGLRNDGYDIKQFSEDHFRVTGIVNGSEQIVDLYPGTGTVYSPKKGWKGKERDIAKWVRACVKPIPRNNPQ